MVPPTARPKRIACSTAPRFSTGSTPGSAMSTAEAWVFGSAPNAVAAAEKILLRVRSCACVSMPTTTSQATLSGLRMNQPAVAAPVDQQRLEIGLRAALLDAVFRHHPHLAAASPPRDIPAPAGKPQAPSP